MVVESSASFDVQKMMNQVEKSLSKFETPKEYYRVDKFVETTTGKIKKEETLKNIIKL